MLTSEAIIIIDSDSDDDVVEIIETKPPKKAAATVPRPSFADSLSSPSALPKRYSINKLFQRDTRDLRLRRKSSKFKPTAPLDMDKLLDADSELADILAPKTTLLPPEPIPDRTMSYNSSSSTLTAQREHKISIPHSASSKRKDMEVEDDVDSYIGSITNSSYSRGLSMEGFRSGIPLGNVQCPKCRFMYPKTDVREHVGLCDGTGAEGKGVKKRTIGAAVAKDEAERKKRNKGIKDTGPTNYYMDSESVLALDGTGFNAEVTGLSWESAGQVRFA